MEQFDVIIVGSDILSLTTALFLARKMRKVLVVNASPNEDDDFEVVTITDPENHKYHFEYQRMNEISGIKPNSLLSRYFKILGLELEIHPYAYLKDYVVSLDNEFTERILSFEQFRTYLVRYYPKQRDQIHRFFQDLDRHYQNFITQYISMLTNRDYTLTSLMIEWGDYSLRDLLSKYFHDGRLIEEFLLNNNINGLDPQKINSYNFFMNFFLSLKENTSYLNYNNSDIKKALIEKLEIIDSKMIVNQKVSHFVKDEQGKVIGFIDAFKNEYRAKYIVVNQNPIDFYSLYFPEMESGIEKLKQYYPNLNSNYKVNTLYIALNQKSSNLGLTDLNYFFKNNYDSEKRFIRVFHYKLFDKDVCADSHSAICVDYCYNEEDPFSVDEILKRLYLAFPKIKKCVVGTKLGKPKQYLSMLSESSVRKGLSINDQILVESGEHTQLFDNLYLIGKWLKPEAAIFGWFHSGIVLADKIEERLYYGEDDDTFYYLTNDEIMMMIRHNYKASEFNIHERHTNFFIGKSEYFIRTKKKNITIHRGTYQNADLSIFSTNDKLSNLLLKKVTFQEVLQSGGFKYLGKIETLYQVVNNFGLDDYVEYSNTDFQKHKINFLGIKFLFSYLLAYSGVAFLTNYIDPIWLLPFGLILTLLTGFFKYKTYRNLNWFEYFIVFIYLASIIIRVGFPDFRFIQTDSPYLLVMGFVFLFSWILDKPIVYDFHRFDYREDYAHSLLFRVINNGVTFLWALVFLGIYIMTFISGERYVSVLYNLVFLGIFLSYYYPIIYVKTNIKQ